ncbi:hypothetical protein OB955_25225 [Halobacteria archaeon AArc-m2/3/4]|uniref:Tat (Twin-arginine translocation) pathway signal sequence n=1 Tax=Natronoglomus mannanivorans TaxID=2979990 RepID=A0ABT2QM09_9EURY|nr:hypothetical protein [Halobacteria archaeon AArc-m2/3/4]
MMDRYPSYPIPTHSVFVNKSWHSRRTFLATGATLTGAAIAGCLGAPASGETEAGEQFADEGAINTSLEDGREEPAGGSELAGSAGEGEPDWVDAHNMRFRGWYYADSHNPGMPYHRNNIKLAIVNRGGYSIHAAAFDENGNGVTDNTLGLSGSWWFNYSKATTATIRVKGSAQSEALEIDLTQGANHEIWFSGAVLTASYWVGRW